MAVLILYYGLSLANLAGSDSSVVPLDDGGVDPPADRITLQVETAEVDVSTGSLDVLVYPVPRGELEGDREGQLDEQLQVQLSSPGQPPMTFDFPSEQIIDPVAASATTTATASRFPFDRPQASLRLEALIEDRPAPIDVELVNADEGWNLTATARRDDQGGLTVDVNARREMLTVTFAVLYITGVVVVAVTTVAVIGGAVVHRRVDFDHVIWQGAMLVVVPALRNEMPGVPPVGTAADRFVFLPAMVIVTVTLLASIVILALQEAASSRTGPEAE